MPPVRMRRAKCGVGGKNLVDNEFERPGLEQVDADPDEREHEADNRSAPETAGNSEARAGKSSWN